ncbi:hypothetical protein K493DRAFT_348760 [Basidiobolus meristosporus CBS 931.73]|uniref:Ribosomal protein L9 domain-containing protein n=1 Tax=Basidiobolus meristosporus CBS 931.73 TaxID=1314790 RepID=A0A1Y1YMF8_9FUNG|nr:hypothetical protein K493DRAFT_348760 [Basidiobolus meristosporus CBS 931.73]|eukprot:ORX99185.1 hypothetical protein K493DRAFT_348760 [Basidiobolus meristosporus CBS 931.73]
MRQKKGIEIKLLADVKNLGKKDDIVTVKPGHMRDDLFPKRLAEYVVKRRVHRNRAAEEAAKLSK